MRREHAAAGIAPHRRPGRWLVFAFLWCHLCAGAQPLPAAAVKAAYLLRFPQYVTWPAGTWDEPADPLVIGVLNADDVFRELSRAAVGRAPTGRPVLVRRMLRADAAEGVHIAHIGGEAQAPAVVALLARHVLVVTDEPHGLGKGAVVNFRLQNDRVRFEASLDAARTASLKMNARLLEVAERVVGMP